MSDTGAYSGQSGGTDLGIPGIDSVTEIGRSAAATTYRVRDVASSQMVVVKVLNTSNLSPGATDRFDREQKAIEGLNEHPNLVTVYGHGFIANGQPYVVAEEVTGGTVAQRLKGGAPMTGPDILQLGVRIAGALESAHRAGVVHGDLRAEDIMLSAIGEPLLADFGIVSVTGITPDRTDDPQRLAHVAPEVLQARGVSPTSDVYGLASILYALLAGEPAFVTPSDYSVIPVITRIASNPPPDLRQKGVPDPVADAVENGMTKDPSGRPSAARDFGRVLQQAQVALGLPMTEMSVFTPAGMPSQPRQEAPAGFEGTQQVVPLRQQPGPSGPPPAEPPGGPPGPGGPGGGPPAGPPGAKQPSRTPLILGAAAVVVLLIGSGLAFALTRDGGDNGDETTTTEPEEEIEAVELDGVADDTDVVSVDVPEDWDDVDGVPFDDGTPNIQASPDIDDFLGSFDVAGVSFSAFTASSQAFPFDPADEDQIEALIDAFAERDTHGDPPEDACDDVDRDDFDENDFSGFLDTYTDCGDEGSDYFVIAAANDDGSVGIVAELTLLDDDEKAAVDDILDSLEADLGA